MCTVRSILLRLATDVWQYFSTKLLWSCGFSIFDVFPLFAAFLFSAIAAMLRGVSGLGGNARHSGNVCSGSCVV